MTDTVVAEGQVKFRDGKKWKTRWVVLRKPSPVADCLSLLVYKDKRKSKDKEKSQYHKERLNVKIEAICGLEPGPGYDGVSYSLSILCLGYSVALGFSSREAASAWEARIRYSLGEVHRFSVHVQPGTKLEIGPASLHLCNTLLVLTRDVPPLVIGHWKLSELRRYGAVTDGFVFEGGSRCGIWSGVFYLSSAEGEQISFHLDCIARGVSPGRAQRGPRPPLPGDPPTSSSEEQMNQEELELEKRLSLLSQCSRPCSMASTYSCSTVAGDDHSSVSSSSSSQSDSSYGSRLLVWAEPTATRSRLSNETVSSSSSTLKALLTGSDGVLYNAAAAAAALRPSSSNQRTAHGLHDSGRQNSLDSGIGIASSGSSASCAGSLDAASQGGAEDFGSAGSLPFPPSRPASPLRLALLPPPSSLPPPPASPLRPPGGPAPGPASRPSTADSGAFARLADEYHAPGGLSLRPCYDTPRSLLRGPAPRDPQGRGGPLATGRDRGGQGPRDSPAELSLLWGRAPARAAVPHSSHSWAGERAPSVDSAGRCGSRRTLFAGRPVCGGSQCAHTTPDNYIVPELWRGCGGGGRVQASNYFPPELLPSAGCRSTPAAYSDGSSTAAGWGEAGGSDGLIKLLMDPQRSQPYLAASLHTAPMKAACSYQMPTAGVSHRPPEVMLSPSLERRLLSTANYVNVPTSPAVAESRRALLNMELHLDTPRAYPAPGPPSTLRGDSVIRYTHLDMAAMKTGQEAMMLAYGQQRDARLSLMGDQRGALT